MTARPLFMAVLGAFFLASCSTLPPECTALFQRIPHETGEGWSDAELRSFAQDAWAYAESQPSRRVQWHVLFYVDIATRRGGSVEVSGEIRAENLRRFFDAAGEEYDPWRVLLISLGQLWRSGQEARAEADQKLDLLQRIENESPTSLVGAIVPHRKVSLFLELEKTGLLRDPGEREEALRQVTIMAERKGDLNSFWDRSTTWMIRRAPVCLTATRLGAIAPPLAGMTLSSANFDLTSTRGTVTLVRFWGFW